MTRFIAAATLAACSAVSAADAHAIAGARTFPVTLTIDDPGVADEASIPTFTFQRLGADGGPGPTYQYNISAEFDKRITDNLGVGSMTASRCRARSTTRRGLACRTSTCC